MFGEMALVLDNQDSEIVNSVLYSVHVNRLEVRKVRLFVIFYDEYYQMLKMSVISSIVQFTQVPYINPIGIKLYGSHCTKPMSGPTLNTVFKPGIPG